MITKVRDKETGAVYSSDMSDENKSKILDINFCTSYTEVTVQDETGGNFPTKNLIIPPIGSEPYWVDMIAINENDIEGEWVDSSPSVPKEVK